MGSNGKVGFEEFWGRQNLFKVENLFEVLTC